MGIEMRKKPPIVRTALIKKVSVQNFTMYIAVGFYENEQPCEVFITMAKEGSTLAGLLDALAIGISFALQFGVPWADLRRKFEFSNFEPSDHNFSSPSDAVAKTVSELISQHGGLEDFGPDGKPGKESNRKGRE